MLGSTGEGDAWSMSFGNAENKLIGSGDCRRRCLSILKTLRDRCGVIAVRRPGSKKQTCRAVEAFDSHAQGSGKACSATLRSRPAYRLTNSESKGKA